MTTPETDWPPPDAHLRAALRHAPDADAAPPAALSARILADARRAVAPPRWWQALGRPAGAAAFASVVLAGFIGLMWRGGPPPPAQPEAPPAVRSQSVPDATRQTEADAPAAAAEGTSSIAAAPSGPVAVPPEFARREKAAGAAGPDGVESRQAAEAAKAAPARNDIAATAPTAPAMADAMRAAPARAEAAAPADPLAPLVARLRADAALPAAWVELQELARGHWSPDGIGSAVPAGRRIAAADGSLLGWLTWEDAAVVFQDARGGARWRAPLAPADAARLRAALSP